MNGKGSSPRPMDVDRQTFGRRWSDTFGSKPTVDQPVCVECGEPVEKARRCYAIPICYGCMPPPLELETVPGT